MVLPEMYLDGRVLCVKGPSYITTDRWGWMMGDYGIFKFSLPLVANLTTARLVLRQFTASKVRLLLEIPVDGAIASTQEGDYTIAVVHLHADGRCFIGT